MEQKLSLVENPSQNNALIELLTSEGTRAVGTAIAIVGVLAKYIKDANHRHQSAKELSEHYDLHDWQYRAIAVYPSAFHKYVGYLILLTAVVQALVLLDSLAANAVTSEIGVTEHHLDVVNVATVVIYLGGAVLYLLFESRLIEQLMAGGLGVVPKWRNTYGWANAKWQMRTEPNRKILAPSERPISSIADEIIEALVQEGPNSKLALRPDGVTDVEAANILYFGHVIEAISRIRYDWTDFYSALGELANEAGECFQPANIASFPDDESYLHVLRGANKYIDDNQQKISNDPALEEAVSKALNTLKHRFHSNAVLMANGGWKHRIHSDYEHVLSNSEHFLDSEGMQRQFAKLFCLWKLRSELRKPPSFKIPFNADMLLKFLDEDALRYEGNSFKYDDQCMLICFESCVQQVVEKVISRIESSTDPKRADWRDKEKARTDARQIDWHWWIIYRADQQLYFIGRSHQSDNWTKRADLIEKVETA